MAEALRAADEAASERLSLAERWRPYRVVLASRLRSQRSFRANFALDLVGSAITGLTELAEVWVLYHAAKVIGGLDIRQAMLVFALAEIGFSLADLVVGHCDRLPMYVREGTLDVFYLRPQPVLLQLMTSDISLRRLARTGVGVAVAAWALSVNHVSWTPASVLLLAIALVSGFLIFTGNFVLAAGLQFFLINGAELTNAFVYGGRYASSQPASVWPRPLVVVFGFAFPMVFCGYLPVVQLLHLPAFSWLPGWLAWFAPLAAVWTWGWALLSWRTGTRHYQGAGG